ncbi:MAG TPA: hypothetical protein VK142_10530 [Bacillota bacterium]|nr:hypothetical protein [Bacillota bacterium]
MYIKRMLVVSVLLFGLAACSDKSDSKADSENLDNLNETGMPIVDEPIELELGLICGDD